MTPETEILNPATLQIVSISLAAIATILWTVVQFNIMRFVKRQDNFSRTKDDHEKRIVAVETEMKQASKNDDRVEHAINEITKDMKDLRITIYEYLLQKNHLEGHK